MRALTLAVLLALLTVGPPAALALDPTRAVTQYLMQTWYAKDGLPQNSVNAVYQTADGYLWFATEEGLARFDGAQFAVYNKKSGSLRHNYVVSLWPARDGGFWIGTLNGGLAHYKNGQFAQHGQELGAANNTVGPIYEDPRGDLWVGTVGGGLTLIRNGHVTRYTKGNGLPSDIVRGMLDDGEGGLWLATPEGLVRFKNGASVVYTTREGLPDNTVMKLYRDREGVIWIGTMGGLSRFEGGKFTNFRRADGLPDDAIYALREDRDGNLWIGTEAGVCRMSHGRFSTLSAKDGLSGDRVRSIFEDHEGSLWVGTFGGGLTRLQDGKFTTFTTREGLAHNGVGPVFQDSAGRIWMGTMGGGVSCFEDGKMVTYTTRNGLASNLVEAICEDHTGAIWLGTFGGGLSRFKNGVFTSLGRKNGLSHDFVMTLHEDRKDALWIGYNGGGLDRYKDGVVTDYSGANGLAHDMVRSIFEDKDGILWIGTFGGGISRFENGRFTNFSTRNGLPHDVIGSIYQDVRGSLWICTIGGGLIRYRDGTFKAITTKNGLFDDTVYAVLEDGQGYFWMTCNNGISRVSHLELDDFADGKIPAVKALAFGEDDGMRSRECNGSSPAALRAKDGRLWFPTLEGVATIDPDHIAFNRTPPPVLIERALADGRELSAGGGVRVRPGKGGLEFHYAALSYIAPGRVRFRYRLEGFDKQWVEAGTRRIAYYTNIPPGDYTFRVTACNGDGLWNPEGAAYVLRLGPHFYQTYAFYGFCAAILALLGGWWHRSRIRRLEERTRELRSLVDERTRTQKALAESHQRLEQALEDLRRAQETLVQQERLRALGQMASGVTHDFNNALTPILGFTDFLLARPQILDDREKTLTYLTNVNTAAKDASQVVKRLREFYRPRDEAELFPLVAIDAIVRQAVSLTQPKWKDQAQARGVSIEIQTALENTPLIPGSESALREMLTNMIFNAVDAMPRGGTIMLRSRVESGSVVLEVADTGTGMTDEVRNRCLEPFFTTKGDEGTGLGLPMVYGIARRHGSAVEIESAPGEGTTFRIRLPIEPTAALEEEALIGAPRGPELRPRGVLVGRDETKMRSHVKERIAADRHVVETAVDGYDGLDKLRTGRFDLIITDRSMPKMSGDQLAGAAKLLCPDTPILLLTGFGEMMADQDERPEGVDLIVGKPVTIDALREAITKLIGKLPTRRAA
jgi:ligand-binding sensor domain-containing protein/signal transduction histidine kinase/CheY-like chemotaxis protein